MMKNLAKLIDLKTFVTMAMTAASIYGFVTRMIEPETFMPLVTMVLTYYFTRKTE